jgi:hypothetical protein
VEQFHEVFVDIGVAGEEPQIGVESGGLDVIVSASDV